MIRQRQYLRSCNAFIAGTSDEEVRFFAEKHGLDARYLRLLIPSRDGQEIAQDLTSGGSVAAAADAEPGR